ncbi:MAG TPA: carboxylating nicotinate-nucleotide diphosphorylase [Candidatus Krumholzibacteria bacterium]|nr:carboxylating nicotinate-nucleotide diphosphorylase [Candidatus Krumholzibacteria bacterium]HPD72811.1 carboxylating nicotinate-nucleotide diphosphorylase [Candidatus Krumholzibacteria bacterium]HRY40257.1 carboxylating nicotinate-nucleotide diphosphorylase [Candidatus Krumholzibacteria bacterium]
MDHPQFPRDPWLATLMDQALCEDIGRGDASTAIAVAATVRATARIVARADGVLAGLPILELLFGRLDRRVGVELLAADGDRVPAGAVAAVLRGPAAPLLTGERTALNFLQHLSGIATLTARYVDAVAGTGCQVLDTRKTVPGWRTLAKYAVRCGGGVNHRLGLDDRIMLKDNHWAAGGDRVADLVARARRAYPDLVIEVEVDSLEQLASVLPLRVEWVLLDNFAPADVREAVARRDRAHAATRLEASGNVTLETIREYAAAGVDACSVGRLTHSAPALDLGLDLEIAP